MASLFDAVEDIKLPDERPKRSFKKFFKIGGPIIAAVVVLGGGYFLYDTYRPRPLTQAQFNSSTGYLIER